MVSSRKEELYLVVQYSGVRLIHYQKYQVNRLVARRINLLKAICMGVTFSVVVFQGDEQQQNGEKTVKNASKWGTPSLSFLSSRDVVPALISLSLESPKTRRKKNEARTGRVFVLSPGTHLHRSTHAWSMTITNMKVHPSKPPEIVFFLFHVAAPPLSTVR